MHTIIPKASSAGALLIILGAGEIYASLGLWPIPAETSAMASAASGTMVLAAGGYFLGAALRQSPLRPLMAPLATLQLLIAAIRLGLLLTLPSDQAIIAPAISNIGYMLAAIGMLALLRRRKLSYSVLAACMATFPLLSALFCLSLYLVNTPFLAPSVADQESPYTAFTLALIAFCVEVGAVRSWRRDGHHSTRFILFSAFSGFACISIGAWFAILFTSYLATIREAENGIATAASFIEAYSERAMDGAELLAQKTLRAVTDESKAAGLEIATDDKEEIIASVGTLPQVYSILVTGSTGTISFRAGKSEEFGKSIENMPDFITLRDSGTESVVGRAVTLSPSGHSVFTLSHRVEKPAGNFAGVVVVVIDNEHFVPIFRRLDVGGSDVRATLTKLNGDVLASNQPQAQSESGSHEAGLAGVKRSDGTVIGEQTTDRETRIAAMRTNQTMGFVTIVSASRDGVLATWRHLAYSTSTALVLVLVGGGMLTWMCHRSVRREEILKRQTDALLDFQDVVFNSAPTAFLAVDTEGVTTLFNRAAENLLGYRSREMLGERAVSRIFDPSELARRARELTAERGTFVPPDDQVVVANAITDPTEEREWTCIRSDGSRISAIVSVSALRDAKGDVVGFMTVMTDSAIRRKAERDLRYSEARLRAILDNVIDGIITIDAGGQVQSVNPAVERIFGYSHTELLNRNVRMLMPNPYRDQHDTYLHNYLTTGRAQIIGKGREVQGLRKDGTIFPLDLAVSQVDLAGRAMFIGVIRDLTVQKRVEKLKTEFVSTVSHELRTPLTGIRGSLSLVNSGVLGEVSDDIKELTLVAEQSTERLIRLINDILDVEKIGSGQMKLDMQPTELAQTVERAVKDTQSFAEQFSVRLVQQSVLPGKISGDFDRLVQIFTNLLSNASKFSPKDGSVEIKMDRPAQGRIRVEVTDHGIGIPEEFRGRIFEKFAQADGSDSKAKGGTGLGLNITRNLVEKMNGRIWFESELGVGTSFFAEFPLLGSSQTLVGEIDSDKFRILHLEDDETIRTIVSRLLADQAEVLGAHNLREGVSLAEQCAFDLAILDLTLGDGSGLDVVPLLHTDIGQPTPVIVFSAHDQVPENLPESVEASLIKSRSTDKELADAVRRIAERSGKIVADGEEALP